jgi:4-aminobutyrate aminotransferase-like enzyme
MSEKPYQTLLNRVQEAGSELTQGNRLGLTEFLEKEHPGDVLFTKWTYPPIIAKGKKNKVWDVDGKEYIDCISGMSCMNIGHGDERIADVLYNQYVFNLDNWFDFPTPERLKLVKRLIEKTPGNFRKRVRLALSGADAVENAIRLARYYTKRTHIISFHGGYHGQNTATIGMTGAGGMHRWYNPAPGNALNVEHFPYAYCYRCPYDKECPSCGIYCVKAIDNLMSSGQSCLGNPMSGVCNVAAMIVEPAQSSAGYIVPPDEFLIKLRELADKYNFLLIFDEVQTGIGRTGKLFACEHSGVVPDILVIGKALGAGYPISAIVGRAEIFEETGPGFICSTYAGSSLGCAVGNKVLDIIEDENMLANCTITGTYLETKLKQLMDEHPLVGNYSCKGLYFGIELVSDRTEKTPATAESIRIVDDMKDAGLLAQLNGYFNNRISFIPPINIGQKDIDEIFKIVNAVIGKVESETKGCPRNLQKA